MNFGFKLPICFGGLELSASFQKCTTSNDIIFIITMLIYDYINEINQILSLLTRIFFDIFLIYGLGLLLRCLAHLFLNLFSIVCLQAALFSIFKLISMEF